MNFPELNASEFNYNSENYNNEFEQIISKITSCYNLMIADTVSLENDENKIRDVLLIKYLKDNKIRASIGLTDYLFDREVPEDTTIGRTDIKVQTSNTFKATEAYYVIECKRLNASNQNGTTGLNAMYIENGINRFVRNYYSSFYKVNGMIGFIVENVDINQNVNFLNTLLTDTYPQNNTVLPISQSELVPEFTFLYTSVHRDVNDLEFKIYHIMMDFSKNLAAEKKDSK